MNYFDCKNSYKYENTEISNESQILVDSVSSPLASYSNNSEVQTNNQAPTKRSKIMFTKEEDKKLIKAVRKFGEHDWKLISSFLENRTSRQCRERWKKFLCPSLNHSPWTKEEDEILLARYQEYGPKWSQISCFFQNRTDISIKTRFTVLSRKMKKEQEFVNQARIFPFQKFFPVSPFMLKPDLNDSYLKKSRKLVKKLTNFVQNSSNNTKPQTIIYTNNTKNDQIDNMQNFIPFENNIIDSTKNYDDIFDTIFSPIQQTIEDDLLNEYDNAYF